MIREILRQAPPGWKHGGYRASSHLYFEHESGRTLTASASPRRVGIAIKATIRNMEKISDELRGKKDSLPDVRHYGGYGNARSR